VNGDTKQRKDKDEEEGYGSEEKQATARRRKEIGGGVRQNGADSGRSGMRDGQRERIFGPWGLAARFP